MKNKHLEKIYNDSEVEKRQKTYDSIKDLICSNKIVICNKIIEIKPDILEYTCVRISIIDYDTNKKEYSFYTTIDDIRNTINIVLSVFSSNDEPIHNTMSFANIIAINYPLIFRQKYNLIPLVELKVLYYECYSENEFLEKDNEKYFTLLKQSNYKHHDSYFNRLIINYHELFDILDNIEKLENYNTISYKIPTYKLI
jgi:hypothetical protein